MACNWYYGTHFIAKHKAARHVHYTSVGHRRRATLAYDQIWCHTKKTGNTWRDATLPEEDRATAIRNMHKNVGEDQTCSSEYTIVEGEIHPQRQTGSS